MAEVASTAGDAVQIGDHAFQMAGTQSGELQLPANLSITDAEFSTDGGDLVLTFPDGTTVRVEGYMDNPNPPTLTSADGAEVTGDVVSAMTGGDGGAAPAAADSPFGFVQTETAQAADQPAHQGGNIADNPQVIAGTDGEPIGNVESLEGEVWAIRVDGSRERLELGAQVYQGDILESGPDGKVGILLADETTFAMGSEGRMVLDEMVYDPATQQGSVSMSVLQGVFTFVSGQVAKTDPDAMTLDTPVATIGIRGTQVGLDLRDGQNLNVTLMEELGGFVGEVVIINDGGTSVLNTANAFTSVSDFDTAPGAFTTVTDTDVINTYADETLKHLPTRNSAGERTSANTYDSNVTGENRESMDFLNDFQTDAGPGLQTFDGKVTVTGEYQGLNRIVQTEVDATVTNPYVDKPIGGDIIIGGNNGTVVDDGDDGGTTGQTGPDPRQGVPAPLLTIIDSGAISNWTYTPETNTFVGTVTGNVDVSGVPGVTFYLTGDNTVNTITTGDGDDTISGTGADDYLDGGAGDDTFIASPGGGNDTYYGGEGNDTITFANENQDLVIDLLTGNQTPAGEEMGTAYEVTPPSSGGIGTDTLISIENVIGGSGNDTITGDAGDNIIRGGLGNDVIDGGEGQDTALFSGSFGQSTFSVSMDGVVTISGPDGTDTITNVENYLFDGSPNLIVGLEDTAISLFPEDHLPAGAAESAGTLQIFGVPDGASLSSGFELPDGSWLVSGDDIEGLTITGALNSSEDFTVTFNTYANDYVTPIETALGNVTWETGSDLVSFLAGGGFVTDLPGIDVPQLPVPPLATGSVDIAVIAQLDPFTISVGGVELTEDGTSGITFAGSEDVAVPLNIQVDLGDSDGNETISITISGLPTAEVHQVTTQVPVLDEFGEPVLGENDEPLFETVTSWQPELDGNGNPVGAHLVYQDAGGNEVTVYPNNTGTYTLSGLSPAELATVSLYGSPDDSGTFNMQFTATVSEDGESSSTVMGSASVTLEAVADVPTVTGGASTTLEDQPIHINFDIDKEDISEHITSVVLTGIPNGSKLAIEYTDPDSGETMMVNLPVVNGVANIPVGFLGENMSTDNLVLTPPSNLSGLFDLQLQVTSSELNNGDTATNYFDMPLTITAVADALGVTINGQSVQDGGTVAINALEDGAFGLDISALTEDTDGSEVISIAISGVPAGATLSAGTNNGDGTWTLTPEEFANLSVTPPLNSDVDFDLTVTVTNVDNNESTSSLTATVAVSLEAIADAAELLVSDITGVEDFAIPLDISSALTDTDESESLSITISGMPAGSVLSAGIDNGDGTWTLTPAQLDGLSLTPGLHVSGLFDLTVTATTTEAANGDQAVVTQQIGLSILPDPDAPVVNVTPVLGNEDTAIALNIAASLVDQDGSETLSVTISGVPTGALLNHGTDLGNGIWEVNPADLGNLKITPPLNSNLDFTLSVTATATESDGQIAETTVDVPVSVLGVADAPTLVAEGVTGLEGAPIALNIVPTLSDTDGSETLSITISNIPDGAFLLSGGNSIGIVDGVATLTPDQLAGLAILPPAGALDDFDLLVTAIATEDDVHLTSNDQGTASVSGLLHINVQEVADTPALLLFNGQGNEDIAVPLNIGAVLTDTTGSEVLTVTVSGLPEGAVLNKGTPNEDGSWTLQSDDLLGLTVKTPENYSGQFSLDVTATSTTDDMTTASKSGSLTVSVAGVADAANLDLSDVTSTEGALIPLDVHIAASLTDTDGSETLTISIDNIPDGAQLFSGVTDLLNLDALTDLVPLNVVNGLVTLTPDQLAGLVMLPPAGLDTDFSLQVTATTTEADAALTGNNQGVSSVSGIINVDMTAVADTPTLILQNASGLEDNAIPLDISAMVEDASETLSIVIGGVPTGAMLSAGSNNNDGTWTLTPAQLANLTITPPADSNEDFQLTVTATSTEQDGTFATSSGTISVGVTGVADTPNLSFGDLTGLEDTGIPLNITASLADTDGSETLSITIAGLPAGAALSVGHNNGDGSWTLTGDQLDGLTLLPPANFSGGIGLTVTATSTENDGDTASVGGPITGLMNITVGAVADVPSLILHDAAGFEDDAIPLEIAATATGGDEIVGVTITGVPIGATLSAGTNNGFGVWTVDPADLDGLTITPPLNTNANFQLGVTVTSMDGDDIAETTQSMNVSVTAVADKPLLNVPSQITVGGLLESADLDISAALGDLDGSESLSVSISNIPVGAVVSLGNSVLDVIGGVVNGLLPNQLPGLQITPPPGFSGNFTIQVTATATDTDPDSTIPSGLETSISVGFIDVVVENLIDVPDIPDLNLEDALGYEDNAIPLDIDASLTDPGETLSLTISGVPTGATLSAGTYMGNGTWSLLPEEADGLTITPPADSNVDFNLTVTATSTTDDGGIATNTGTIAVDVIGVADQPNLDASVGLGTVVGGEGFRDIPEFDHAISNVVMYVKGADGSVDKIKIDDFSAGSEEIHDVNDLDLIGFVNDHFPGAELVGVSVKAGNNGGLLGPGEGEFFLLDPGTIINSLPLLDHVDQTFDFVQSMGDYLGGTVGELTTVFPLDIASSLNDVDGSETLSITVSDLPLGVTLSAGTQNSDGTWTLTPEQLDGLSISVPMGIDPDFDFNVTATATENDGDTASVSTSVGILGDTDAEAPELEVSSAAGDEDTAIALDIDARLTDTDGSETLSITITDVPAGAVLSAGTDNGNGTWTLTPEQLIGLTVTPPADSDVDFVLSVTATSREISTGDIATRTAPLTVTVNAVADAPSVAAGNADGDVGQTVLLDISSMLSDTDGSESLSITVAGFPDGASLNAGVLNGDGSYTLSVADLDGLAISLPSGSSADFDLTVTATSTEAANLDQASNVVQAVVNVDPLAGDDRNVVEIGQITTGNVLTGESDSVNPSAAADTGTETGNSIASVSFGAVSKSFGNPDDVASDEFGNYVEIVGEHGTLKMYEDGSYDYQAEAGEPVSHLAGLTGTASSGAVQEAWSGVQTFAFDFGTSFVDGDGRFDPSLADAQVSFNSNGIGVVGGASGAGPADQINHSEDSQQSEALGINLGGETTSATLTVSNMFRDEEGGEQGAWQAFDAQGNLVGQGVLNASTVDYSGSNNVGTATISVPGGVAFQYIVFMATATGNEGNNNDSSDFFVRALQFETNAAPSGEDVFGYTMQDADGDTASATLTIDVAQQQDVTASDPTLSVQDVTGYEDTPIALDIAAALTDIDGSEDLTITISGMPNGAVLSAGSDNGDGTWTVPAEQLAGLTVTPPADSNVDFDLTVTATSTEANGGDTAVTTATFSVNVTGVADTPSVTAADVAGGEDQWIGLDLSGALTDTDNSETLSVTIVGVPAGAILSVGTVDGNGNWTVPASSLDTLSILPPENFSGTMDMALSVTSTENDGDSATKELPFTVTVTPDADAPVVTVGNASGYEDNAIPLDISAALTDTDGSETLSIVISGVPTGATLSAGTPNQDGTWSVTAQDLNGLSVTPPHNSNVDFVLTVQATSTEEGGNSATTSVAVPVHVTGVADLPTLSATLGAPVEIPGTTDITITNMGQVSAGYNNSYGYYVKDANGNPTDGVIIWDNAKNDVGDTFTIEGVDPDSIGFFVIPDGDSRNVLLGDNTPVHFQQDNGGNWYAVTSLGLRINGADDPVLFSDPALNEGNFDYTTDNNVGGNQNWEDLFGGGDHDFNDVNVNVEYSATPGTNMVSYALDIDTGLTDTDGSETLSITIDDLPAGATLSAGTHNPDGSWSLTPAQLAGLTLTVQEGADDFNLSITSTSTENDGDTASISTTLGVTPPTGDTTASDPSLTVTTASGYEDNAIALNINALLTDTDGSETLSVTIAGVPTGAVLSAGQNNGDGTWTLTGPELNGLTITPPHDSNVDFNLSVTATSTEYNGGATSSTSATLGVSVTGVADMPTLSVSLGEGQLAYVGGSGGGSTPQNDFVDNNQQTHYGTSGEDNFVIDRNLRMNENFQMGDGNDSITVNGDTSQGHNFNMGGGNDSVTLNGDIKGNTAVDGGSGDDVIYLGKAQSHYQFQNFTNNQGHINTQIKDLDTGKIITVNNVEAIAFGDGNVVGNANLVQTEPVTTAVPQVTYDLNIQSSLTDTDGSETLSITVAGVPSDAVLSAGTNNGNGTWTLTPAQLAGLQVTVTGDNAGQELDLTVTATATENDGDTASISASVNNSGVETDPNAEGVVLETSNATGFEDTAIALDIDVTQLDTDGSESVSITISGVPSGAELSAGTHNADGTWTLTPQQLAGLTITPPADSNTDIDLVVTTTTTESSTGATATSTANLYVAVTGVADDADAAAADVSGSEDQWIALDLSAALSDTDGSESLSVTISGVPAGAALSAGTDAGNGVWTVPASSLGSLAILPAANFAGAMAMSMSVTTTENDGDTSTVAVPFTVTVTPEADAPTLTIGHAAGLEDLPIALDIAAALTDTDGSETLSIILGDVPTGAVLSAGINNGDGTWTLTGADLNGLTITAPHNSNVDFALSITATSTEAGGGSATSTATLNVGVTGVADVPTLSVALRQGTVVTEGGEAIDVTIGVDNVLDTDAGFTVTARTIGSNGQLGAASADNLSFHAQPQGFGVTGSASGDNSELGYNGSTHVSEQIIVDFDNDVSSVDVSFAWMHSGEHAKYELYQNGVKVGEGVITGITDNIDPEVTLSANGQAFDQVVFSAPGNGDDYLINSISFEAVGEGAVSIIEYPLDITSALTDTDGSETLSITVGGIPAGATLSAGTDNGNGTWTLTPQQLAGLTLSVDAGSEDFNLSVTATTTENDGDTASVSTSVAVDLPDSITDTTASSPELSGTDAAGLEDRPIALNIDAALTDTDGSESLSITIAGVPSGARLSAGTDNGNGTWTLTEDDLDGLTITPPANSNADFTLNVTATSTESVGGATASQSIALGVNVTGVADAPTLAVNLGAPTQVPATSDMVFTNAGQVSAGYLNSYGYYIKDADGNPTEGMVLWNNSSSDQGKTFTLEDVDPDTIGFFVIPDGGSRNSGLGDYTPVTFQQDGNGNWFPVTANGTHLRGADTDALFGDPSLNQDGRNYVVDNSLAGNQNWEDLVGGGDLDFNDVNINVATHANAGTGVVEYPLNITSSLTDTDGSETLSVTVTGLPSGAQLSAGTNNGNGSWTLTPAQLAGLTLTVPEGTGDFDLSVTATSTENDGDSASVSTSVDVFAPVPEDVTASAPELSAGNASGLEDGAIALNIAAALTDTDGSETLAVTIAGVPSGATLSAGTYNGNGTWTLTEDQLDGLTITPAANSNADFTLSVTATATESNGGATSTQSIALGVNVTGVADAPTLSATVDQGVEVGGETSIPVAQSILNAANSGSGRSIVISGVPSGAELSAGTHNANGTWTLTPAQLNNLSITPADGATGNVSLNFAVVQTGGTPSTLVSDNFNNGVSGWGNSVSAYSGKMNIDYNDVASKTFDFGAAHAGQTVTISFDASAYGGWDSSGYNRDYLQMTANGQQVLNSSASSTTHTVTVTLDQNGRVALGMNVSTTASDEGMLIDNFTIKTGSTWTSTVATNTTTVTLAEEAVQYDLDIVSALTDTDGSETLSVTVDELPVGATLSAGTHNADGSWTLTAGQLAGLTMTVPAGTNGFDLDIRATATENDGNTKTVVMALPVAGGANGDFTAAGAEITASNVSGLEDNAIALDIDVTQLDADGSESTTITISGVPNGANLSAGTHNSDGTWTLTTGQLEGLSITPAANSSNDFTLTVTASTTENANGATVVNTASFTVDVTGVADAANLSASATLAAATPRDDLVAYYEVSEGEHSIGDSVGSNSGTPHGVCIDTHSDGPSGASLVFDGYNDYVEVPHNDTMEMDSGTFVLWFNTDDADDKQSLFSKDSKGYDDGGHVSAWVHDGQVEVRLQSGNNSYMVKGGDVSSGAWHQMAFSFGPDGMALYLDGELVDSDAYSGGLGGNEEPLVFGADQSYSGDHMANKLRDFFDGKMDQIGIYDRPLTPTELANMYDSGVTQITTGTGETLVYDLDIQGSLVDIDGSESLSIQVRGLPDGAHLSAGTDNGDGSWTLTTAQLDGLTLNVDANVGDDFSIEVVAITTEQDGDSTETVASLAIDVPVADPMEIYGTWQNESLTGASGGDTLYGGDGNDTLFGLGGNDILNGGTGHDSLFGDTGDDLLNGGDGDDYLSGGAGSDTLDGGSGTDTLFGGDGNDVMFGNHGNDFLDGGAGNDTLDGGTGHDAIFGGAGNDGIGGGDGNDTLYGGSGNDTIDGGSGDDTIVGGEGDDVLTGGWGSDVFKMDADSGHDIIKDIMEQDTIVFEGQQFHADDMIFNENEDGDVVISFAGVEGQSVTLNGVSMDDLDQNNDGDPSDGYSITETEHGVSVTIDPNQ